MDAHPPSVEAAEWSILGMAARAVLARAVADEPEVFSLAVSAALSPSGGVAIEVEFRNRQGAPIAGLEL